jgi:hypothetical protein
LVRRFRRIIHVVDSSTIALIAFCIDWAQHRRRKAAAKLHVRLDLHSPLPRFVLAESADVTPGGDRHHDLPGERRTARARPTDGGA